MAHHVLRVQPQRTSLSRSHDVAVIPVSFDTKEALISPNDGDTGSSGAGAKEEHVAPIDLRIGESGDALCPILQGAAPVGDRDLPLGSLARRGGPIARRCGSCIR